MKDELAQAILKNEMRCWNLAESSREILNIQVISDIKYDDYQQYTQGMRYIESIALWLRQFDTIEDKKAAYDFVNKKLIFISEEEMRQLVMYAFPLKMKPFLIEKTKKYCEKKRITDKEERKNIFKYYKKSSLFLGLSDGAHMDFFRRQNSELSNEQFFVHYDFSRAKAEKTQEDFLKDPFITECHEKYSELSQYDFKNFYLIDDFTGSGKSFVRKEKEAWTGKIPKFIKLLEDYGFGYKYANIHVILYIATNQAIKYIKEQLEQYVSEKGLLPITVDTVQIVYPLNIKEYEEFNDLIKRNYEKYINKGYKSYEDEHFKKGGGRTPYYGFADCALSVVLAHNTPNNSFPILWYSWENHVNALFPRITRHKEV